MTETNQYHIPGTVYVERNFLKKTHEKSDKFSGSFRTAGVEFTIKCRLYFLGGPSSIDWGGEVVKKQKSHFHGSIFKLLIGFEKTCLKTIIII